MKILNRFGAGLVLVFVTACAHTKTDAVSESEAARINRKLVRQAVVFEPGAEDGAVVPDLSAPQLRATIIPEHLENGRLIERHREWSLEGEVSILGTQQPSGGKKR